MNCSKALFLIDLVLDGAATPEEEQMLHFHVAGCPSCRRALKMSRDLSSVFRSLSRPEVPVDLEARVRSRLAADSTGRPARRRIFRLSRIAVALPFVAALLLVLGLTIGGGGSGDTLAAAAGSDAKVAAVSGTTIKYSVTTPALAAYARPASLVTF